MEEFQVVVAEICNIYLTAEALFNEGVHVYSTDEKMGIQAREHANAKHSMESGRPERVDPEYI